MPFCHCGCHPESVESVFVNAKEEEVIALGATIIRLRKELNDAESRLAELLGTQRPTTASVVVSVESLPERIVRRLNETPGKAYAAGDLMDVANGSTIQTVRSALLRLADKKKIYKAGRGMFCVPPPVPPLPPLPPPSNSLFNAFNGATSGNAFNGGK